MSNKTIILLFILGLLLRLLLTFSLPYPSYPEKVDDAHQYDVMACNILSGHGLSQKESSPFEPTICRTPGYPVFLASIFMIFGHSYNAVYIIQALISVLTALLVYIIAFKTFVTHKKQVASLSYILAIFCPFLWFSVRMLYTEVLITFLVTFLILLIIYALEKKDLWLYVASGLITGLALLIRPALSLFAFFLILLMFLTKEKKDRFSSLIKKALIYLVAVMLIWSTWVARNYVVFKKFLPLSIASGSYIYLGTFSPNRYEKDFPLDSKEWNYYLFKEGDEILALDEEYKKKGIERIKSKPFTYIKYSLQRIPILWLSSFSHFFNIDASMSELKTELTKKIAEKQNLAKELTLIFIKLFLSFINILYVLAAILGMILLSRYWRRYYPLLLVPLYFTLAHMFFGQANARYVIPAWPILIIFSAFGLLSFTNRLKDTFAKDSK